MAVVTGVPPTTLSRPKVAKMHTQEWKRESAPTAHLGRGEKARLMFTLAFQFLLLTMP